MSIYSGFPTRRDEEKYNCLLAQLLSTLQQHLLSLIGPEVPQRQARTYSRILSRMRDYEEHKYLPPKFSELLGPLARAIGVQELAEKKVEVDEAEERERAKDSSRSLHKHKFNAGLHEQLTEVSRKAEFALGL